MNAATILTDLNARGVRIWTEADRLKLDAPAGILTDDDKAQLAAHKSELLAILADYPGEADHSRDQGADRSKAGTADSPFPVQAQEMPDLCPFDDCAGKLESRNSNRYQCARCFWWFEWRPAPAAEPGDVEMSTAGIPTPGTKLRKHEGELDADGNCSLCRKRPIAQGHGFSWCADCRLWFVAAAATAVAVIGSLGIRITVPDEVEGSECQN